MTNREFSFSIAIALASTSVYAQQLVTGLTGAECAARGGTIRTWTSSIEVQPSRGECWIPPQIGRGGSGGAVGAPATSPLGAAAGFAGALGNFIDTMNQIQADRQERQRQWEQGLQQEREQWMNQKVQQEGAQLQHEAELRERERQQAAANSQAGAIGPNPFAPNPFAAPNPSGAAPATSFKTDAQIKSECASSGNPSMCELALSDARAHDPAYQQWKAAESARLDENVRRSKAEVDRLMAERARNGGNQTTDPVTSPFDPGAFQPQPYNSNDPDLAKCREGSNNPWTIAGCWDMQAQPAAKPPGSLRDRLRKALADDQDDPSSQDDAQNQAPRVASAPGTAPSAPQAPNSAAPPGAANPWSSGPWRTRDERACRDAGGVLANPENADDLTGIPQVAIDNPDVSRAQLAATPYCVAVPGMQPSETAAEVKRLSTRAPEQKE